MVAAHSRWRAVAETSDLTSVVGPRVRFLCLDANETHVVLGANTGSLYVFARRRASADATEDPSSDAAARDAPSPEGDDDRRGGNDSGGPAFAGPAVGVVWSPRWGAAGSGSLSYATLGQGWGPGPWSSLPER